MAGSQLWGNNSRFNSEQWAQVAIPTDRGKDVPIHDRRTHRWFDSGCASIGASLFTQQEELTMPIRIKRTTPFQKQCAFMMDLGEDLIERCEASAEIGIYYGNDAMVTMISLCRFHAIYQESLWRGERE